MSSPLRYHFRFPRDETQTRVWADVFRRSDSVGAKNVVCSKNFSSDNDIDGMKSRLLGVKSPRNTRLLKLVAVPSLILV